MDHPYCFVGSSGSCSKRCSCNGVVIQTYVLDAICYEQNLFIYAMLECSIIYIITFVYIQQAEIQYIVASHKFQILDSKFKTLPTRLSNKAKNSYTHKLHKV